ncbi:MAG: hypothetical protein N2201_02760 [candidate division WOR-3 bacterium]|nr:hypothetical protein [candidate division WOR-3 bacterium]
MINVRKLINPKMINIAKDKRECLKTTMFLRRQKKLYPTDESKKIKSKLCQLSVAII